MLLPRPRCRDGRTGRGHGPDSPPPFLKDRYRLPEERGQGSKGLLYRARDAPLGREVAIKFLPPFVANDVLGVLSQILNSPVPPLRPTLPVLPPALERVVLRLLSKDPAKRYASAEEVLAALPGEHELAAVGFPVAEDRGGPVLSLLERIVRSSAISRRPEPAAGPAEETSAPAGVPTDLTPGVLLYAALEDTAAALEAERRRLAGLEMLLTAADPTMPLLNVRHAISAALQVIVHIERLRDGSRRVLKVTEVQGQQGDAIALQDIFEFRQEGMAEGRVRGRFSATAQLPRVLPALHEAGLVVPLEMFRPRGSED